MRCSLLYFVRRKREGRRETLQKLISCITTLTRCWYKQNSQGDHSTRKAIPDDQVRFQAYRSIEPFFANKQGVGWRVETTQIHTSPPKKPWKINCYFLFEISTSTNLKGNLSNRSKCTEITSHLSTAPLSRRFCKPHTTYESTKNIW